MKQLTVHGVHYRYRGANVETLCGVDAVFSAGQLSIIAGRSGAGKSTLLYLLGGLDCPCKGEICLDDTALTAKKLDWYRREVAATVSQGNLLLPGRTALENVMYPQLLHRTAKEQAQKAAEQALCAVGIDAQTAQRRVEKLSGGEQQRVAIARCMAAQSQIIVADEPTGNLDSENADAVFSLLLRLAHAQGKCVIVATHDRSFFEKADCLYRMENGNVSS